MAPEVFQFSYNFKKLLGFLRVDGIRKELSLPGQTTPGSLCSFSSPGSLQAIYRTSFFPGSFSGSYRTSFQADFYSSYRTSLRTIRSTSYRTSFRLGMGTGFSGSGSPRYRSSLRPGSGFSKLDIQEYKQRFNLPETECYAAGYGLHLI